MKYNLVVMGNLTSYFEKHDLREYVWDSMQDLVWKDDFIDFALDNRITQEEITNAQNSDKTFSENDFDWLVTILTDPSDVYIDEVNLSCDLIVFNIEIEISDLKEYIKSVT